MSGNNSVNRPPDRGQEILFLMLAVSLTYHVTLGKLFPLCVPDLESGGIALFQKICVMAC